MLYDETFHCDLLSIPIEFASVLFDSDVGIWRCATAVGGWDLFVRDGG